MAISSSLLPGNVVRLITNRRYRQHICQLCRMRFICRYIDISPHIYIYIYIYIAYFASIGPPLSLLIQTNKIARPFNRIDNYYSKIPSSVIIIIIIRSISAIPLSLPLSLSLYFLYPRFLIPSSSSSSHTRSKYTA